MGLLTLEHLTFRFSGALSRREHLPGKAPTAQLTRIDTADRLFSALFNTHNKCTGVCRFVRGVPVGIARHVAELWSFAGWQNPLTQLRPTDPIAQLSEADDHFRVT
jgi:hypothetical protein